MLSNERPYFDTRNESIDDAFVTSACRSRRRRVDRFVLGPTGMTCRFDPAGRTGNGLDAGGQRDWSLMAGGAPGHRTFEARTRTKRPVTTTPAIGPERRCRSVFDIERLRNRGGPRPPSLRNGPRPL